MVVFFSLATTFSHDLALSELLWWWLSQHPVSEEIPPGKESCSKSHLWLGCHFPQIINFNFDLLISQNYYKSRSQVFLTTYTNQPSSDNIILLAYNKVLKYIFNGLGICISWSFISPGKSFIFRLNNHGWSMHPALTPW